MFRGNQATSDILFMVSMEYVQTEFLRGIFQLSYPVLQVNEDLEMAKLNLSRELKLCMEDRNGGGGAGAGVTGTPQK